MKVRQLIPCSRIVQAGFGIIMAQLVRKNGSIPYLKTGRPVRQSGFPIVLLLFEAKNAAKRLWR